MENKNKTTDAIMQKMLKDDRYKKLVHCLEIARGFLDEMPPGSKTNMKELADKVAKALNVSMTQVKPYVDMAVQSYDGITVSRGRFGGIFKGIKEKKEDNRTRCITCHQVLRQKRKKIATDGAAALNVSTINDDTSDENHDDEGDFDDDDDSSEDVSSDASDDSEE